MAVQEAHRRPGVWDTLHPWSHSPADLQKILAPGTDLVINFAAETHVDRSIEGSTEFLKTNVI